MLRQEREVARSSHYAILLYAYFLSSFVASMSKRSKREKPSNEIFCQPVGIAMKAALKPLARRSQNNYYRRRTSDRPHPLKNFDSLVKIESFRRGEEICSAAESVERRHLFFSGAARRCTIRSDGHRQIVDLLLPGDFFGLAFGEQSDATIESVSLQAR